MDSFFNLILILNKFIWNNFLIFVLGGIGIFYTFKLKFIQIRKFKKAISQVWGDFSLSGKSAGKEGMSSFQSLATAIAGQVGTGNLAGAATALTAGGPGAIFWMWVSAFFGMATIYAEAVLAQKFKTIDKDGNRLGGPAFYIEQGLKSKKLAILFSILLILALGFIGNMVQSNSVAHAFQEAFHIPGPYIGATLAIMAGFVFFGGTKRIASVTEKIVPIMAGMYLLGGFIIILLNIENLFPALKQIVGGAFSTQSIAGGTLGITVKQAIRYGVSRGLFSNEAGMGSTPHAHALAKVKAPEDQGLVAIIGSFVDTFVVLNITVFVILTTNSLGQGYEGITVTQMAFASTLGRFGSIFIAVCLLFFAFSTIISWYLYGEINTKYLFKNNKKGILVYQILVLLFIAMGTCCKVTYVWELADLFNGLMIIPNVIALVYLSKHINK